MGDTGLLVQANTALEFSALLSRREVRWKGEDQRNIKGKTNNGGLVYLEFNAVVLPAEIS